jgi:phage virion morphogenesis protein
VKVEYSTSGTDRLLDKLADKKPLLDAIGEYLVASTRTRIRTTKTAPDGTGWAPWAASTAAARVKTGGTLLYQSGALYDSITAQSTGDTVAVSSALDYAPYLQFGTPNMPARPFLGISEADAQFAVREAARRIFGKD